ncbi:MAG: AtpZ/AtpI family protein [Bauldia sp.]
MRHKDGKSDPQAAEDAALSGRLRDLDKRLGENRAARGRGVDERPEPPRAGAALAMRMAADFVAGILVGAAIGWGVDQLFGTWPWGLAVFLLLGFAAGILSVIRTSGVARAPAGGGDGFAPPAKDDEED